MFPPKRVSTGPTGSVRTKSEHKMELSVKHPEWTLYASQLILVCISDPSELVWSYNSPYRVSTGRTNSMQTKSWHEMKLCCRHPWVDFICALAHVSMHFECIQGGVSVSSKTGFHGYYKLRADKIETKYNTLNGLYMCPSSFWYAFPIYLSRCETILHIGLRWAL